MKFALSFSPLIKVASTLFSVSLICVIALFKYNEIPFCINSFSKTVTISSSNWERICGNISTIETSSPFIRRFSAISTPIKPPPITIALSICFLSTKCFIASVSGIFLSTSTLLLSIPGMLGLKALAPGDRTR